MAKDNDDIDLTEFRKFTSKIRDHLEVIDDNLMDLAVENLSNTDKEQFVENLKDIKNYEGNLFTE